MNWVRVKFSPVARVGLCALWLIASAGFAETVEVWHSNSDTGSMDRFQRIEGASVEYSIIGKHREVVYRLPEHGRFVEHRALIPTKDYMDALLVLEWESAGLQRAYNTHLNVKPTGIAILITPNTVEVRVLVSITDLYPFANPKEPPRVYGNVFPAIQFSEPFHFGLPPTQASKFSAIATTVSQQKFALGNLSDEWAPLEVVILGYRNVSPSERRALVAEKSILQDPTATNVPVYLVPQEAIRKSGGVDLSSIEIDKEALQSYRQVILSPWVHRHIGLKPGLTFIERADAAIQFLDSEKDVGPCVWYLGAEED